MRSTKGWSYIDAIIKKRMKDLKKQMDDETLSMDETFSCKHRIHGVKLILDDIDALVSDGVEARDFLLNNPISEPSE